jgi:hypothetical protein
MLLDMIQQPELFQWYEVITVEMSWFIQHNIVYKISIIVDDNDSGIHINMLNMLQLCNPDDRHQHIHQCNLNMMN